MCARAMAVLDTRACGGWGAPCAKAVRGVCGAWGALCLTRACGAWGALYIHFFVFKQFGRLLSCERLSSNVGSGMLLAEMVNTLHGGAWYA